MPDSSSPNRLRELRKAHQMRLVDAAHLAGKDQSVYLRYERGDTMIPLEVARKLAERWSVSIEDLMGWDHNAEEVA